MSSYSLREFLRAWGSETKQGVRHIAPELPNISLRNLLSMVTGDIYDKWLSLGGGNGLLGHPIGNCQESNGKRSQRFENGSIYTSECGFLLASLLDGRQLPLTPYSLVLESVKCNQETPGSGMDEFALCTVVSASEGSDRPLRTEVKRWRGDFDSGTEANPGIQLFYGLLRDAITISLLGVEVDSESDAEECLSSFERDISSQDKLLAMSLGELALAASYAVPSAASVGALIGAETATATAIVCTEAGCIEVSGSAGAAIAGGLIGALIAVGVVLIACVVIRIMDALQPDLLVLDRSISPASRIMLFLRNGTVPDTWNNKYEIGENETKKTVFVECAYALDSSDLIEKRTYKVEDANYSLTFRHHFPSWAEYRLHR